MKFYFNHSKLLNKHIWSHLVAEVVQ